MKRLSVKEAAKRLGMQPEYVRYLMDREVLPIGYVVKRPGGGKRNTYLIFEGLLKKAIGEEEENDEKGV